MGAEFDQESLRDLKEINKKLRHKSVLYNLSFKNCTKKTIPVVIGELILLSLVLSNYKNIHLTQGYIPVAGVTFLLFALISQTLFQILFLTPFNINALAKYSLWGFFMGALTDFLISKLFLISNPSVRIIIDQAFVLPLYCVLFLLFSSLWDNQSFSHHMKTHFKNMIKGSYLIWFPYSFMSLNFFPQFYITPATGFVQLFWLIFNAALLATKEVTA